MKVPRRNAFRRAVPVVLAAASTFAVLAAWDRTDLNVIAAIALLATPTVAGMLASLLRPQRQTFILDGLAATVTMALILAVVEASGRSYYENPRWLIGTAIFAQVLVPPLLLVGVVSLFLGRR
jgi:peptidoglycan/LPS O-acetylase OafA/YrhL